MIREQLTLEISAACSSHGAICQLFTLVYTAPLLVRRMANIRCERNVCATQRHATSV